MVITETTRLGLHHWSDEDDPVARVQFDQDMRRLDVVMVDAHGPGVADRPAASSVPRGTYWSDDSTGVVYRSDGAAWSRVTSDSVDVSLVAPESELWGSPGVVGASPQAVPVDHAHATPLHDDAAHGGVPLSAFAVPTAPVAMGGHRLKMLAAPSSADDAATKSYVDAAFDLEGMI